MSKNLKIPLSFSFALLFLAVFATAPLLHAAELVNINSADKAALTTLNGIGDVKAQAVIDYRTANGPFAAIEDIMNVSGIGTATFNNIKDYITVGGAAQTQPAPVEAPGAQTDTRPQAQSAGNSPPALTVRITADRRSAAGGGSYFSAAAYGAEDLPLPGARFIWNFGDGAAAEGARVFHTYAYPGKYAVSATAAYHYSSGVARMVVEAAATLVSLEAEGDGSLTLRNNSPQEADIGLWSLVDAGKSYVIPEGTIILAGEGVRFAAAITNLPGSPSAILLYPNSAPAAAASVAKGSPLRGERVAKAGVAAAPVRAAALQTLQPESSVEVLGVEDSLEEQQGGTTALWGSLAALAGLLVAGGAGAHYLRRPAIKEETSLTAEEFEIE